MANTHWRNGSGLPDPTAAKAIDNETKQKKQDQRDQFVKSKIGECLSLLNKHGLRSVERLEILDTKTGKVYK